VRRGRQVDLVQQHDVSEGDLLLGLLGVAQSGLEVQRVHQRDNTLQAVPELDVVIDKESLSHRSCTKQYAFNESMSISQNRKEIAHRAR